MEKTIFLIGFMGVGKSTLGKKLAKKLDVPFYDTDKEIEKIEGKTIQEIFSLYGELYFRELEKKWLQNFSITNAVIATGGGMPCDINRLFLMKSLGTVVYLERPIKELFVRLKDAKKKRPLVASLSEDELFTLIQKLLDERSPFYNQAHLVLKRDNQDITSVLNVLANKTKINQSRS